ncbi:MAG: hypothetical protein NZ957_02070 [Thaumarchaeota archaeon]|nr:hypothetical protein [Candidatus Calditenuaceae archaeon]MDW8041933.1 hypothetical protein [Nitrososphaerota archaeon]
MKPYALLLAALVAAGSADETSYTPPSFTVYEFSQLVCVMRQVGDYRLQILLEPTNPTAGSPTMITAVISTLDGKAARVHVALMIATDLLPEAFIKPVEVKNGVFSVEHTFQKPGRYVLGFTVLGENGTYLVNVPVTVMEGSRALLSSLVVFSVVLAVFWGVAALLSFALIRERKHPKGAARGA